MTALISQDLWCSGSACAWAPGFPIHKQNTGTKNEKNCKDGLEQLAKHQMSRHMTWKVIALLIWVRTQIETEMEHYRALICLSFRVFNEQLTMTHEQRVALYFESLASFLMLARHNED